MDNSYKVHPRIKDTAKQGQRVASRLVTQVAKSSPPQPILTVLTKLNDLEKQYFAKTIVERDDGYALLQRHGENKGKILGKHKTKEEALAQERAIQASKHMNKSTADDVVKYGRVTGGRLTSDIGTPPIDVAYIKQSPFKGNIKELLHSEEKFPKVKELSGAEHIQNSLNRETIPFDVTRQHKTGRARESFSVDGTEKQSMERSTKVYPKEAAKTTAKLSGFTGGRTEEESPFGGEEHKVEIHPLELTGGTARVLVPHKLREGLHTTNIQNSMEVNMPESMEMKELKTRILCTLEKQIYLMEMQAGPELVSDEYLVKSYGSISAIPNNILKESRPPSSWFDNCVEKVEKGGFADNPYAYCISLWSESGKFKGGEKTKESFGKSDDAGDEMIDKSVVETRALNPQEKGRKRERLVEDAGSGGEAEDVTGDPTKVRAREFLSPKGKEQVKVETN